ncbi:MAG: putative O-methyltransferase YrrM [Myxococcota bacterium]|jgi:predicted O-methyltransferase YrrM
MTRTAPLPLLPDPASRVLEIATAGFTARAVHVAAELGIADHLADGPRDVAVLASDLGVHAPSLLRLMRALASVDLMEQLTADRFALTPSGQTLRSDVPGSVRGSVRLMSLWWGPWEALRHSIATGQAAAPRVWGQPAFDHLAQHREQLAVFHEGMASLNARLLPALVRSLAVPDRGHVVDIAGGHGTLLAALLAHRPTLTGTLFDRPEVALDALAFLSRQGLADRTRCVGGDLFEEVPDDGDAYLLKWILHDWNDDDCVRILERVRRAMRPGVRLHIVERVLGEAVTASPQDHRDCLSDLRMLVALGGQERTETAFRRLLFRAGLTLERVIHTGVDVSILVAAPALEARA